MFKKSMLTAMAFVVSLMVLFSFGCDEIEETENNGWYIPDDFGDEYYHETVRIIKEMWDNEQGHLDDMTTRIAQKIRSGGTVIWDANASHFSLYDTDPSLPCLPKGGMNSSMAFSGNKANIDNLKKGDILVTNFINEQTYNAHDRGVHVIGVINSYFRNNKFGDDNANLRANYEQYPQFLDEISNEIFDSHATSNIGLVWVPYITERKVGPGIGNFMGALYWLVVSEVANKMVKGDDAPSLEYAEKYIDILFKRLDKIYNKQHDAIWSAAAQTAEKIGNGGHMYVDSEPQGVRSSASGMSMGLMFTNRWKKDLMKQGDVIFIADVTDDPDSKMVQEARAAKEKGAFIIASGPSTQRELKALADVYFDNLSPEGYGLFDIEGHENKIALVGSLINNVIYNTFSMQMTYDMCRRGWYPKYYSSYIWQQSAGYHGWAGWVVNKVGY